MRTVWLNEPRRSTTRLKYEHAQDQDQDHDIIIHERCEGERRIIQTAFTSGGRKEWRFFPAVNRCVSYVAS